MPGQWMEEAGAEWWEGGEGGSHSPLRQGGSVWGGVEPGGSSDTSSSHWGSEDGEDALWEGLGWKGQVRE